jgi:hypothetical protein
VQDAAAEAALQACETQPASSSLTMPATRPYTPIVITTAMLARTATCGPKAASATMPRVMTMISAERTKSVRIAPLDLVLFEGYQVDLGIG